MAHRTPTAGASAAKWDNLFRAKARVEITGANGKSYRAMVRTVSAIEGGASIKQAHAPHTPPSPPAPRPLLLYLSHLALYRGLRVQEKRTVAVRRGESGLGIDVSERNVILRVLPHSLAAADCVLREGDVIVAVDGEELGKRWLAEVRTPGLMCMHHACTAHVRMGSLPCP